MQWDALDLTLLKHSLYVVSRFLENPGKIILRGTSEEYLCFERSYLVLRGCTNVDMACDL